MSKCDWIKHLHVKVAFWEEKGVHTIGCTCRKSCIDDIKCCVNERLKLCTNQRLIPNVYEEEVEAFFEFLKLNKFDTNRIRKLVQRRNCVVRLLNFLVSYNRLNDFERQQVSNRFETHHIESLVEIVQTLTGVLRSTPNINSGVSSESYIEAESTFNDTTWLRHMYRLCMIILNKMEGRVEWKNVQNGEDPNNAHTNPVTGTNQEFTRRETLISKLRSLVPQCLQQFSFPLPYTGEVQLLLAFLGGGDLDKKKIRQEQKLRKIAIGLNDVLLTVLKMRNDLNEIFRNIESSRRSQLITCLTDLGHRLEVLSQNTNELQALSEDEQTGNQSNHDCETDRKEPSADAIVYANEENTADPVTVKMMIVSNLKATSNGSKEEMIDFDKNGEPSCSHEKTCDLTITYDRDSEYHLSDPIMPIEQCPDLEQDVTNQPLMSETIFGQGFHHLLATADKMDLLQLSPSNGDGLFDQLFADMSDTVSDPNSDECSRWTGSKHSFTTDTCTHDMSYAVSDLSLGEAMENVSNSPSTNEVDISNEDDILGGFVGLGDDVINTMDETQLRKCDEMIMKPSKHCAERLHQTTVQSEGSGGIGFPAKQAPGGSDCHIGNENAFHNSRINSRNAGFDVCYSSGSSSSETAVLSSEAEPNGSCSQPSLVDPFPGNPKEHLPNTNRRKRKRRAADD